jgi:hypothetical protein
MKNSTTRPEMASSLLLAALAFAGCGSDAPPAFSVDGTDADADGDSDVDGDTDADGDTDTDTDIDTCPDEFPYESSWGWSWQEDNEQHTWVVGWSAEDGIEDGSQYYSVGFSFNVQAWESYGAPMEPHTDVLSGDNSSWATCWYCAFLDEAVTWDKWDEWHMVERKAAYLGCDGVIEIADIGPGRIAGTITDAVFCEVDEDVVPIEDGYRLCFDLVEFSADW